MLEKDRELLRSIIKEYDFDDFIKAAVEEMVCHMDNLYDLGLKERYLNYFQSFNKIFKDYNS